MHESGPAHHPRAPPDLRKRDAGRVTLPVQLEDGPGWAAETNRRKVATLVRSHSLGSWVGGSRFPSFVTFYPNFVAHSRVGVANVAMSEVLRAGWAASLRLS